MRLYVEIQRRDEEQRMVWGYASTDEPAMDGMVIQRSALEDALDDYMRFANIREMHRNSAVGVAREAEVDERGLYIGAYVSDDTAWQKVKDEVYKGFSIGAKVTERDEADPTLIRGLNLIEISLVDRPMDPGAVFDVWRAATPAGEEIDRREFTAAERKKLAKSGAAMPDGSYPVENSEDLKNAVQAFGRAKNKAAVKRHIKARARALGLESELPEDWRMKRSAEVEEQADVARGAADDAAVDAGATDEAEAGPEHEPAPEETEVARAARLATEAAAAAGDAVAQVERAVALDPIVAVLPEDELRRGIPAVGRLGCILVDLAYLVNDTAWESSIEGDSSPVPAALKGALVSLAEAYKMMSQEEVDELLKTANPEVMGKVGTMYLSASGADLERAAPAQPGQEPGEGEIQRLSAAVDTLTQERATLLGTVDDLTKGMNELAQRVAALGAQAMPPKTAGPGARVVEKSADASGDLSRTETPALSEADVRRHLDALPDEERALVLTRAALSRPIPIT